MATDRVEQLLLTIAHARIKDAIRAALAQAEQDGAADAQSSLAGLADVIDANTDLERQLAECRADAERYRWLRSAKFMDIAACWLLPVNLNALSSPEELDDAIDAARTVASSTDEACR